MGKSTPLHLGLLVPLLTSLLLMGGCSHRPPAPPPDPGEIITRRQHSFYYFDLNYSIGRLDNRLRVMGTISNTIPTDLNRFMVTLTVKSAATVSGEETDEQNDGRIITRISSPFFDVEDMENTIFVLDLPLIHGPCVFSFRCDYLHFDDMAEGRRGALTGESDWNYFDDRIDLP